MANFFSTGSFNLIQGDTSYINLAVTDDSGNPLDISGYEFYFTAKTNPSLDDSAASLYLTQTTHSNASGGITSFLISSDNTTSSLAGKYFYDIRFKDTVGNITTLQSDSYYLIGQISGNTTTR